MKKLILTLIIIVNMFCVSVGAAESPWYVNTDNLNCRAEPSMTGEVLKTFSKGTALAGIGYKNGWIQVYDGVTTGWCYGKYLFQYPAVKQTNNNIGEYIGEFTATYYTTSPAENGGGYRTATGHRLKDVVGVCIAADPKVIPYYSKVYIEGIGYRTVLDCGGAIKGNKIDILVNSRTDIPSVGRHSVKIYLVE